MRPAGYVLTGMRKYRSRAHPPMILAHGLTTDFFDERAGYYPDFETFNTWPATARVLWQLRDLDRLAGQSSVADFAAWRDPATRRFMLCTRRELARQRYETMFQCNHVSRETCFHENK